MDTRSRGGHRREGEDNKKPRQKPGQVVGSFMNDQPVTVMFTAFGPLPRRSGSVS